MPKAERPVEAWRQWDAADQEAQPKRVCSVAGCKGKPAMVRETKAGKTGVRRHVFCKKHVPVKSGG